MAQQSVTQLVDDVDGTPADETVRFALDGTTYELDLSAANALELRASVGQWVVHARRVRTDTTQTKRRRSRTDPNVDAVREWARANGYSVGDRGRIAAAVREAYSAAAH